MRDPTWARDAQRTRYHARIEVGVALWSLYREVGRPIGAWRIARAARCDATRLIGWLRALGIYDSPARIDDPLAWRRYVEAQRYIAATRNEGGESEDQRTHDVAR